MLKILLSSSSSLVSEAIHCYGVFLKEETKGAKKASHVPLFKTFPDSLRDFFIKKVKQYDIALQKGKNFLWEYDNKLFLFLVLGEEKKLKRDELVNSLYAAYGRCQQESRKLIFHFDSFQSPLETKSVFSGAVDAMLLGSYQFDKYLSVKKTLKLQEVLFSGASTKDLKRELEERQHVIKSTNFVRDLVIEPPNVLTIAELASRVVEDAKRELGPRVKSKVLDKEKIKKERMNLLLAVNQGSPTPPKVVHLTYTPPTARGQKHIALVGKGLVFDTGGVSLKPSQGMLGMKEDMAGAATMYGVFRSAVLLGCKHRLSLFLGITDNLMDGQSILPESIVKSREGSTVEILNTDAEGRLVLADVMSYAQDFKPDILIDMATLTGACVAALGEACGVMGNELSLQQQFVDCTQKMSEHACVLPIFDFYKDKMKSKIADLKNIAGYGVSGGAQLGAVFLSHFIKEGVQWMHLDIAGISGGSDFIPYLPRHLASGRMVRSLTEFLMHV